MVDRWYWANIDQCRRSHQDPYQPKLQVDLDLDEADSLRV